MKKNYNRIIIIFSLIIFLYYILNRRVIHEGLADDYNQMTKKEKEQHKDKFQNIRSKFNDIQYKNFKAVGGMYNDYKRYEDILTKGQAKDISESDLDKIKNDIDNYNQKIKDHKNIFQKTRDKFNDLGYKRLKSTGMDLDTYKKYDQILNKGNSADIMDDELRKIQKSIDDSNTKMKEHSKIFKETRNKFNKIGYKYFKAVGGVYSTYEDYDNTLNKNQAKDISIVDLDKIQKGVEEYYDKKQKYKEHEKKFNKAKKEFKNLKEQKLLDKGMTQDTYNRYKSILIDGTAEDISDTDLDEIKKDLDEKKIGISIGESNR